MGEDQLRFQKEGFIGEKGILKERVNRNSYPKSEKTGPSKLSERPNLETEAERASINSEELETKLQESITQRKRAEKQAEDLVQRVLLLEEQSKAMKKTKKNQENSSKPKPPGVSQEKSKVFDDPLPH